MKFLLLLLLFQGGAASAELLLGKTQAVRAPICLTAADMIPLAKLDAENGAEGPVKAMLGLRANPNCGIGEAMMKAIRVVFSVKAERGMIRVVEVEVEMADDSKAILYILTDTEVIGLTSIQNPGALRLSLEG